MIGSKGSEGGERPRLSRTELAAVLFSKGNLDVTDWERHVRLVARDNGQGKLTHVIEVHRAATEQEGGGFIREGTYAGVSPITALDGLLQGRPQIVDTLTVAALEAQRKREKQ